MEQEREATELTEAAIEHKGPQNFIINTAAFHNAHLLRRALSRELTEPVTLLGDEERRQVHNEYATKLRAVMFNKRKALALVQWHR